MRGFLLARGVPSCDTAHLCELSSEGFLQHDMTAMIRMYWGKKRVSLTNSQLLLAFTYRSIGLLRPSGVLTIMKLVSRHHWGVPRFTSIYKKIPNPPACSPYWLRLLQMFCSFLILRVCIESVTRIWHCQATPTSDSYIWGLYTVMYSTGKVPQWCEETLTQPSVPSSSFLSPKYPTKTLKHRKTSEVSHMGGKTKSKVTLHVFILPPLVMTERIPCRNVLISASDFCSDSELHVV